MIRRVVYGHWHKDTFAMMLVSGSVGFAFGWPAAVVTALVCGAVAGVIEGLRS